ncbi:MAG TPA: PAS domain-containing protein, partial [Allosphingosinicella sp.]|nr:PAS domain-containing protein [Allosphingosinicella sp.]
PFVLITGRDPPDEELRIARALAHATLVERPIHPPVLLNAAQAALRSRARQREAKAFLLERGGAEEHLRQLTSTLETRVGQRMSEIRATNKRLLQEVEERRAAEERLRDSEELHRYTLELTQQIAWTADADGTFRTISPRYSEVTGLPPGPQRGAMHPDDADRVLEGWQQAVVSGEPHVSEFRMRVRDGSYRTFRGRVAPRRDSNGEIIQWFGTSEDIHDWKQSELARIEAEERYRLAARATNDAIWDFDLTTGQLLWNDSDAPVFGYAVAGQATDLAWWEEKLHPDERHRIVASFDAAITRRHSRWSAAYRFRTATEDYADIFDRCFFIRNDEGEVVRAVGAMMDVTDRRRADAELRQMQAELIHVSRLSAMGTMASTLAHEINQPLTAVTNYVLGSRRLLEGDRKEAIPQVLEALEAAESASLRAGQIVRKLRELVSRGNVSPGPEELPKLIEDASLIAFVDEHLHGVTHRTDLDPKAIWVDVDRIQIQQVLINLIRNAVEAMENQPRREVTIRTRAAPNAMVEVSVADTGSGIPADVREALFSPFKSTKADGMGIGLSISRTIVEAHRGNIWAEDSDGGGAVFRFTLPRMEAPEEEASAS